MMETKDLDGRKPLRRIVTALAIVPVLVLILKVALDNKRDAASQAKVRTFEFTYTTQVTDIPSTCKAVEIWLPIPTSDENQKIHETHIESPYPGKITKDREYGNSMLYTSVNDPKTSSIKLTMRFKVERHEQLRRGPSNKDELSTVSESDPQLVRWLAPDKMASVDESIRQLAGSIVRTDSKTDLEKARRLYDYTVSNFKFDKTGIGWGRGDLRYALEVKKGNCADFNAVFIALCRALHIPARLETGFLLPWNAGSGQVGGYHCWAQFYQKQYGWVPVDCSEGSKNASRRDYYFGALDQNRVQFTTGRNLTLSPSPKGHELNFFIYPYVEVDGKPFDAVEKIFLFKDLH